MPRISLVLGSVCLLTVTACGGTNFNAFFTSQEQKQAQDQLLIKAQYEYDQGNNDEALSLTDDILKVNPYEEKTLILRSYAYLSKAGLDGFSLSGKMIEQNTESKAAGKTAESTDTLASLATVIGMDDTQLGLLGTEDSTTGTKVYLPLSRSAARAAASEIMENIDNAVSALCPIIPNDSSKPKITSTTTKIDTRHTCELSPFTIQGQAKSHFAWSLAHLGEAVAFFSVILYDDGSKGTDGKSLGVNIQRVSSGLNPNDVTAFLTKLTTLTKALNKIFPTDPTLADDSMLNAMFNDLESTSQGFANMGGVPESVTKSIDDVIAKLKEQIKKVSATTDSGATSEAAKQNAAVRNELTKAMANGLDDKVNKITDTTQLNQACELFKQINSEPSAQPTKCK